MTEEHKIRLSKLCQELLFSEAIFDAHINCIKIRDYVETLIDEAVKDAINAYKADK